jgi:hypothetical protein
MEQVTNTSDMPQLVGGVEIAPHSTAEIDDAVVTEAKRAKATLILFASGKLKLGKRAAKAEADKRATVHATQPARRGVTTARAVVAPKPSENYVAKPKHSE